MTILRTYLFFISL